MLLGGVFTLDQDARDRWPQAAAWQLPVGDPARLGAPSAPDEPPFQLDRGVEWSHGRATHQGADLGNGRAGDPVRAAAGGLVTLVYDGDNGNGYGGHVVVAHRLEEGGTVYSVYAHLLAGSIAVRPGDVVAVGDAVGRVGRTGRASTPHLHCEIREARRLDERWENAPVLDPLAFVAAHAADDAAPAGAPAGAADSERAYVRWAVDQGLLAKATDPAGPLDRGTWWRMLAAAAVAGPGAPGLPAEALRDSLMDSGLLPDEESGAPADEALAWSEMARDVERLRQVGTRVPHGPLPAPAHEAACEARFGQRAIADHPGALRHRAGAPSIADACTVLADVSGPRPEPRYVRADRHVRPARAHAKRHHRRRRRRRRAKAPTPRA